MKSFMSCLVSASLLIAAFDVAAAGRIATTTVSGVATVSGETLVIGGHSYAMPPWLKTRMQKESLEGKTVIATVSAAGSQSPPRVLAITSGSGTAQ